MLWLRIFWLLLLDPPRYLQPYHLPLLPDVVSFRFFTHAAEYLVRISIVFQEIAHDSPDILTGVQLLIAASYRRSASSSISASLTGWLANLFTLLMMMVAFFLNTGTLFLHFFGTPGEEASCAPMLCTTGFKIACLLPCGILSFKLTLQKRTDRAGEGDAWCAVGVRMHPACPAGLLFPGRRVSRANGHRAARSRATD
jgi:hypothetical protein